LKWCKYYNVWCDEVEEIIELPRDFLECGSGDGDYCQHAEEIKTKRR
jgi:hypothetical protein